MEGPRRRFAVPLLPALFVLFSLAAPASGQAGAPADAQALVDQTTKAFLSAIRTRRDEIHEDPRRAYSMVDEIVAPHLDFERISRWVLGKHWRTATEQQRQTFRVEFRTMLYRTYATAATEHTDATIVYLPWKMGRTENQVTVRSELPQPGAPPLPLDYRLVYEDGAWKLVDMVVAGVSMVATYRGEFSAEIGRVGIDGFLKQLAEKNRENGGG